MLWRAASIASRADDLGRIIAGSIVTWLAAQVFINVGMTMGIMPMTGVLLPFASYGGSAIFVDALTVGLLIGIGRRCRVRRPQPSPCDAGPVRSERSTCHAGIGGDAWPTAPDEEPLADVPAL